MDGCYPTGRDHTWWYFFDMNTNAPVGNFLDYKRSYTYTEYLDFVEVNGLKINSSRKSYGSDRDLTSIVLKALYENSEIKFGDILPNELFTYP